MHTFIKNTKLPHILGIFSWKGGKIKPPFKIYSCLLKGYINETHILCMSFYIICTSRYIRIKGESIKDIGGKLVLPFASMFRYASSKSWGQVIHSSAYFNAASRSNRMALPSADTEKRMLASRKMRITRLTVS